MRERGPGVDPGTVQRRFVHYAPLLEQVFRQRKKQPGERWRRDETTIKVNGQWKYFYRAVDKPGNTIEFLLSARRDKKAALRFFVRAIRRKGKPGLINIDKSGSNTAAIKQVNRNY